MKQPCRNIPKAVGYLSAVVWDNGLRYSVSWSSVSK